MDGDPMPVVPPTAAMAQTMDVSDAPRKEDRKEDAMPPPSPGMQARLDADDDLSELIPKIQMNTASNNRCEANAMPTRDSQQDWTLLSASQAGGITTISASRPLASPCACERSSCHYAPQICE